VEKTSDGAVDLAGELDFFFLLFVFRISTLFLLASVFFFLDFGFGSFEFVPVDPK